MGMARFCFPVVVLLIGFLSAAVAGGSGPLTTGGGGCAAASTLVADLAASCAAVGEMAVPDPSCCSPVVASVELGTACFCRVASEMHAGLNAPALLALYTRCGGAHIHHACHAVAAASGAGVVRALSSTVANGDGVPDVAGGVTQPPPQQQTTVVVTRTAHLSSKDRKVLIGLLACQTIQLSVVLGIGMRNLYRHCYGPK